MKIYNLYDKLLIGRRDLQLIKKISGRDCCFSCSFFLLFFSCPFAYHSQWGGCRCVRPQLGIILAQIVLGPPCLSCDLGRGSPIHHRLFLKPSSSLINPLSSHSEMIKGKASKSFMEIITHSLSKCLTSALSWHRSRSINHQHRSDKRGWWNVETYILTGNQRGCYQWWITEQAAIK